MSIKFGDVRCFAGSVPADVSSASSGSASEESYRHLPGLRRPPLLTWYLAYFVNYDATYGSLGPASLQFIHVRKLFVFPARVFHSIKVLIKRIKLLVIYSPPMARTPQK